MTRCVFIGALALTLSITLLAPQAVGEEIVYGFGGSGNLLESPVVYHGAIDESNDPRLSGGYWEIVIEDSDWPSPVDGPARWDYIWTRFFADNYNYYTFEWTGYFNYVIGSPVHWRVGRAGIGELSGRVDLEVRIIDHDADGIADVEDLSQAQFSGAIVVNQKTGVWPLRCGIGWLTCECINADPFSWGSDLISNGEGRFRLESCALPVDTSTWGHVKERYGPD